MPSSPADSRARKRQKLDTSISSAITSNGASSSYARRPAPRSAVSDPDIQVIEPPRATLNRSNPVPNDAEIIDLGASSDDLGERVPRPPKSSSPDPILLLSAQRAVHPFETHPTEYGSSASNKGKGRAKEPPERVEGSEEDEDIEEFTPPPPKGWPFNAGGSRGIPTGVVHERKRFYENGAHASAPAAIHHSVDKGVNVVDLTTRTVISRMKRKDEVSAR